MKLKYAKHPNLTDECSQQTLTFQRRQRKYIQNCMQIIRTVDIIRNIYLETWGQHINHVMKYSYDLSSLLAQRQYLTSGKVPLGRCISRCQRWMKNKVLLNQKPTKEVVSCNRKNSLSILSVHLHPVQTMKSQCHCNAVSKCSGERAVHFHTQNSEPKGQNTATFSQINSTNRK